MPHLAFLAQAMLKHLTYSMHSKKVRYFNRTRNPIGKNYFEDVNLNVNCRRISYCNIKLTVPNCITQSILSRKDKLQNRINTLYSFKLVPKVLPGITLHTYEIWNYLKKRRNCYKLRDGESVIERELLQNVRIMIELELLLM